MKRVDDKKEVGRGGGGRDQMSEGVTVQMR